MASAVSPRFWLYWAVTIPFTVLVVSMWLLWERRRAKAYEEEGINMERGVDCMEAVIMATMANDRS
jgi:hypothetical protein